MQPDLIIFIYIMFKMLKISWLSNSFVQVYQPPSFPSYQSYVPILSVHLVLRSTEMNSSCLCDLGLKSDRLTSEDTVKDNSFPMNLSIAYSSRVKGREAIDFFPSFSDLFLESYLGPAQVIVILY